ncbi:hypothetical protein EK904_007565 [Melospiza melodia maxima]|nr:hypothetical protein EK904_007565 [Melospiza melodia maxima]
MEHWCNWAAQGTGSQREFQREPQDLGCASDEPHWGIRMQCPCLPAWPMGKQGTLARAQHTLQHRHGPAGTRLKAPGAHKGGYEEIENSVRQLPGWRPACALQRKLSYQTESYQLHPLSKQWDYDAEEDGVAEQSQERDQESAKVLLLTSTDCQWCVGKVYLEYEQCATTLTCSNNHKAKGRAEVLHTWHGLSTAAAQTLVHLTRVGDNNAVCEYAAQKGVTSPVSEEDGDMSDTRGTQKRQTLVQLCPSCLLDPAQCNKLRTHLPGKDVSSPHIKHVHESLHQLHQFANNLLHWLKRACLPMLLTFIIGRTCGWVVTLTKVFKEVFMH